MDKIVGYILKAAPQNYKCAYHVLNQQLGTKSFEMDLAVAGANSSLVDFNKSKLQSNPCFATLEEKFIGQLWKLKAESRPTTKQRAGEAPYSAFTPGFAMDLAVQLANNDKRLAIELIGICGNDDAESNMGRVTIKQPIDNAYATNASIHIEQELADAKMQLKMNQDLELVLKILLRLFFNTLMT